MSALPSSRAVRLADSAVRATQGAGRTPAAAGRAGSGGNTPWG
ncbi:hypothetical protein [Sphaerisporangium aureirubrum]|uniref:Uncharacterized protein n=1 Tax=Sphaerisporangium aureirubrum TaxID=1544736 RepID=A0ABW1NJA4_9ACTN